MPIRFDSRALLSRPIWPALPAFQRAKVRGDRSSRVAAWSSVTLQSVNRLSAALNMAAASASLIGSGAKGLASVLIRVSAILCFPAVAIWRYIADVLPDGKDRG